MGPIVLLLVLCVVGSSSTTGTWILPKSSTNYITQAPTVANSQANPHKIVHDQNGNAILLWSQFNGTTSKLHTAYYDITSKKQFYF
jgi:hypothetical protein